MPTEKPVVLPLDGAEVREAILFKLNESLKKTCHLGDSCAYTAFKADIVVRLVLIDYGRETPDNHIVSASDGEIPADAPVVEHHIEIPAAPPNDVRVETNQSVPVQTVIDGKQIVKKVRYAPRKANK